MSEENKNIKRDRDTFIALGISDLHTINRLANIKLQDYGRLKKISIDLEKLGYPSNNFRANEKK